MASSETWMCMSCKHPECRRDDYLYHLTSKYGHNLDKDKTKIYGHLCTKIGDEDNYVEGYIYNFYVDGVVVVTAIRNYKYIKGEA